MPPKSKPQEEAEVPLLGRFSTQLKIGIVGMPNVGKSSFFNILTNSQVPAENYPFCTIDPHESRVAVPDKRLDYLAETYKPASLVPAFLNVVDIAGLVAGASNGDGLGNAFLSHIKACDAIFHMTRAFDDIHISHVDGEVDPIRDIKIINNELRLKDIEYVTGRLEQMQKTVVRANERSKFPELDCLKKVSKVLEEGKWVRHVKDWNAKEVEALNQHLLITAKPVIYIANISEKDYCSKKNKWLAKIKGWIDENDPGSMLIPFSAVFESKVMQMPSDEVEAYTREKNCTSVIPKLIQSGFNVLQLEYFFTAGKDEVKAWTVQKGTKAPQAAGKIHTDFEKGFIVAEVMKFDDLKQCSGNEANVKAAGKYRQEGKSYVVQDGDIIFFKFNVSQSGAAKKK